MAIARPPWGDEAHYLETVARFRQGVSWELLRTYAGGLAPPLPFLAFAGWGQIAGNGVTVLRVFALLTAFATFLLVHRFGFLVLGDAGLALVLALFVALHPYNAGLSVFVFNDMLATLFVMLASIAVVQQRPVMLSLALACALWSRQYMVLFAIAAGGLFAWRWLIGRTRRDLAMASAAALSTVPLLALMWYWQGFGPDNDARVEYLQHGLAYKMPGLMLCRALLSVYSRAGAGVLSRQGDASQRRSGTRGGGRIRGLADRRRRRPDRGRHRDGGFFHRLLKWATPPWAEHALWAASAAYGGVVAATLAMRLPAAMRDRARHGEAFTYLCVLSFLAVMPFVIHGTGRSTSCPSCPPPRSH